MSDTPRTNAIEDLPAGTPEWQRIDAYRAHSRLLERELNAALAENERLRSPAMIRCPFCYEDGFDQEGLKAHVHLAWCKPYNDLDINHRLSAEDDIQHEAIIQARKLHAESEEATAKLSNELHAKTL